MQLTTFRIKKLIIIHRNENQHIIFNVETHMLVLLVG